MIVGTHTVFVIVTISVVVVSSIFVTSLVFGPVVASSTTVDPISITAVAPRVALIVA